MVGRSPLMNAQRKAARALRLTAYECALHASGEEATRLDALTRAVAAGVVSVPDARLCVNALRREQQARSVRVAA